MQEQTQLELPTEKTDTALQSLSEALSLVGQKTYDGNIKRFNEWNRGEAVNAKRILKFFDYLVIEKNLNPVTLMNYRFSIKAALKAELRDLRQIMAIDAFFKRIKHVKKDSKIYEENTLSQDEFEKLKAACPSKIALIITVLYYSGMRISEVLGIRLKDCELGDSYVRVSILGKGSKMRRVFIERSVFEKIRKVFQSREKEFLFQSPSKKESKAYGREHVARQIRKYARKALPNTRIHPHTFRHTFATRHIKAKGSVKAVANYLGHANTSTTEQMYLHDQMSVEELWPLKKENTEAA